MRLGFLFFFFFLHFSFLLHLRSIWFISVSFTLYIFFFISFFLYFLLRSFVLFLFSLFVNFENCSDFLTQLVIILWFWIWLFYCYFIMTVFTNIKRVSVLQLVKIQFISCYINKATLFLRNFESKIWIVWLESCRIMYQS